MSAESKSKIRYGPARLPWDEQVPPRASVAPPQQDPMNVYPKVPPVTNGFPDIDYRMFEIPPTGLSEAEHAVALAAFRDFAERQHEHFTGYQTNQNQKYSSRLSWLLDMHTNSVGDPFSSGWFTLNTKFLERACLDYFAALWNIEWPHVEPDLAELANMSEEDREAELEQIRRRYWGWVLSMGSTEANLYSLFNARDYLKGLSLKDEQYLHKPDPKLAPESYYKPVIFYSQDAHYSVIKCVRILELTEFKKEAERRWNEVEADRKTKGEPNEWDNPLLKEGTEPTDKERETWPEQVPSDKYGAIDDDDLEKLVKPFLDAGYPIILVLNFGSTWKGAYDDVKEVHDMLKDFGDEEEYKWLWSRKRDFADEDPDPEMRRGFWVHVDGALGAAYMPFLEMAKDEHGWKPEHPWKKEEPERLPSFDFRHRAVMSICASTHKWPGAPWAGSVYMTRTEYQLFPPSNPSYIGAADTTLGGSRNAMTAALLWDYLARTSYEDSMQAAMKAEAAAVFLTRKLQALEDSLNINRGRSDKIDLWIEHSPLSLAVRFRLVNEPLVYKYTIDREALTVKKPNGKKEVRVCCHVYFMQSMTRELALQLVEDIREACRTGWRTAFPAKDWLDEKPNPREPEPEPEVEESVRARAMRLPTGQGFGSAGPSLGAKRAALRRKEVTVG